ncbi:MAG: DNA polymerase III subunit gamma/tau, partial [Deltaproteobacteria bacterium]|nr:DNA polymerase III subunit gamma/tau [Deltaproteobacteria bacterium]MBW2535142.1 DNA polymerase III subunit gamma/tau [Deltaproteobacteria bacterium]
MSYLVLARKWRPQRFDEVVGQQHVTRTLAGAIEKDRVAHAFLFTGVRGVGKTSLARILAKALNCAEGPTVQPCGECDSCRAVTAGTALDVIEIDGASNNSVDDVRELRETVPYRPVLGRYKIYVIDEVHMLSISAFNALLKTLEEPPPHVKFIFATTEPHKIPVTILSRCQRYDFRRIPTRAIIGRIGEILGSEEIEADAGALQLIGREADGSMRDALSILDQVLASGAEQITAEGVASLLGVADRRIYHELSAALVGGDPRRCLELARDVDRQGYDIPAFARGLLEHMRDLVVLGVCDGDTSLVDMADEEAEELARQARSVPVDTLHRTFKHLGEAYDGIARASQPRILLEATLARIASLGDLVPAADLVQRLEALERSGGGPRGGGSSSGGGGTGRGQGPPRRAGAESGRGPKASAAPAAQPEPPEMPEPPEIPEPPEMPEPPEHARLDQRPSRSSGDGDGPRRPLPTGVE